jgi:hypothetical protein
MLNGMQYGWGSGLMGLIILIADIYAIIQVLGSGASTGTKLLWVLLILFLPVIGLIIWLLAGPGNRRATL